FASVLLLVSLSGLMAFMVYQELVVGDPFAFVAAQESWGLRPPMDAQAEAARLLTLEPLTAVYIPSSEAWWKHFDPVSPAWASLQFANPIYFTGTAGLVILVALKGWLDPWDSLFSMLLLSIPYAVHGYSSAMAAHGRYAMVAFPVYTVLARLLCEIPPWGRALAYAASL